MDSLELARHIVELISDKMGEDVLLLDIRDVTILADYFVIATVNSTRQSKAVVEHVRTELKTIDARLARIDGEADTGWTLMDYTDVIVHLFTPEMRAYYDLEELWQEGRIVVRVL